MTRSEARTARTSGDGHTARTVPVNAGGGSEAPIVLERYRLVRQLGAGAFGTVWMARDERLERDVAVKIVPRDRIVGGRFEREARAAARLAHPGVVTLYEAGTDDHGAYLVSELVRGSTLGELLDAGSLSDREIIGIGIALCDALAHAHAENVVHRDVKPSNVLIPKRPSNPASVAKLTDFGVARIVGGDTLTRAGDVIGTAAYMAPEQAEGRDAGAPADLYALALVIYEGLTGVNPVRSGTAAQRTRRLAAHLPPLRRQRHDLPHELGQAIDLALRPRASERGTIEDLRRALATVSDRMSDQPGVVAPAWRPGRSDAVAPNRAESSADRQPTAEESLARSEAARWPERGLAALAAGGIAAWLTANLLPNSPVAPFAVAVLAATVVAALPRLGWLSFVVVMAAWLAASGQVGAAIVVALGGLLPVLLAPWRGTVWGLPVGAAALGAAGLAGAWPAVAGRARGPLTRAALGATGWVWTLLASALSGTDLYLRSLPGAPPPGQWTTSAGVTAHQVIEPLIRSGALAPAIVWAGAAVILPWVVRGRTLALDFVLASAWAAGLVAATYAALQTVHGSLAGVTFRGAVLGGVAALAVVLAPSVMRTCRTGRVFARVP